METKTFCLIFRRGFATATAKFPSADVGALAGKGRLGFRLLQAMVRRMPFS